MASPFFPEKYQEDGTGALLVPMLSMIVTAAANAAVPAGFAGFSVAERFIGNDKDTIA
jgi:hypothetical protein